MTKYFLLMFTSVFVASIAQVLLKKSANKKHDSIIKEYLNPYVIIGYGLIFSCTLLSVLAYKGLPLKYGSIIESLGYVLIMIFGKLFFNEKITINKLIGNILIVIGVIVFCL